MADKSQEKKASSSLPTRKEQEETNEADEITEAREASVTTTVDQC